MRQIIKFRQKSYENYGNLENAAIFSNVIVSEENIQE